MEIFYWHDLSEKDQRYFERESIIIEEEEGFQVVETSAGHVAKLIFDPALLKTLD